jgi:glycosyltransferase involved in cell wall biosynthesis
VGRVAGLLYRWLTPGTLWGRPRRCRFVHTYHGHIFHGYYGRLRTGVFLTIEKLLARLITDRIVVVSEQQRQEIQETFAVGLREQFTVIPLGLDLSVFSRWSERGDAFRKELGIRPDELLVGIVGRLTEIKNHELFLRAVALFKENFQVGQRVRFVVVGDGGLRGRLETLTQQLGLETNVIFAGNRKDPEEFYPALNVVALTSRNEGTPLTLIEAMANARPVIATAVGGVVDLLGTEVSPDSSQPFVVCQRGISVDSGNAEGMAAGLARLAEDVTLRGELATAGLEYVAARHSKERLLEDIRELYRQLLPQESLENTNGLRDFQSREATRAGIR